MVGGSARHGELEELLRDVSQALLQPCVLSALCTVRIIRLPHVRRFEGGFPPVNAPPQTGLFPRELLERGRRGRPVLARHGCCASLVMVRAMLLVRSGAAR